MIRKIKTILILLFCMAFVLSYISGCASPASVNLIQKKSKSQTDTGEEVTSQRLDEIKNKLISPPVVLSHRSGEIIYGSGDRELIFIKGYADKGNTIEVYVNGVLAQSNVVVDTNGNFETSNGVEINEGKNIIKLIAVKPSGAKSLPTEFTIYLNIPQKVEYKIYENNENLKEIGSTYYSVEDNPGVYIKGKHMPMSSIFIKVNDNLVGEIESDDNGIFELSDIILKTGDNEIAVWAKTMDGFTSAPVSTNVKVVSNLDVPYPSTLTGYSKGNANYLNWTKSADTDFDSYKLVRVEDPCTNPEYPENDVIATFSNIGSTSYVDKNIISGRSYYYTLWTLDKGGRAISSNVIAIPKPVYSIQIKPLPATGDSTISRREWYYQPFEITNTGNVTVNIQPFMVWIKLDPSFDEEKEISPIWEVHLWNPENGQYYYSEEDIYETYVADWAKTDGYTVTEEKTEYREEYGKEDGDGFISERIDTVIKTTELTEKRSVNLKRVMKTTVKTTVTITDLTTGDKEKTTTTDSTTKLVEPEKVGSPIEGIKPGEKIIIEVKIQNIAAENGEKIIAHFHFAPVDCDGHFYTDEIVSTGDVIAIGRSRF
ncbi:MAG: hypothetical protein PHG41_03220 [Actinomycetota bacterium]|nr:hypothetical protein [Actinomycetota bacterium]